MSNKQMIAIGDVVQINDPEDSWYPALLIVDDVRNWGVIAYCLTPQMNDGSTPCGQAYKRLGFEKI